MDPLYTLDLRASCARASKYPKTTLNSLKIAIFRYSESEVGTTLRKNEHKRRSVRFRSELVLIIRNRAERRSVLK